MSPEHSPPTKASLLKWWSQFTHAQRAKKDPENDKDEHPVFGKPLKESLKRASVQISTANTNGELYVWGYIPVVVAKCGLYLKENATEVPGTFRVNGSAKRMKDLQAAFETPPRYGKSLDWKNEPYTTHDVASVLRRYLTKMPEPVIPLNLYQDFRDALANTPYSEEQVIATYKHLIQRMPRANQYLLLYVLDLLSVFARKSDKNLMTAFNLAVIFQPGLISHPNHVLSPIEHQLSQKVLEFLIEHQDQFVLDIPPPPRSEPSPSWRPPRQHHLAPPPRQDEDPDLVVIPSSDDEPPSAGGWKLAGQRRRITRRRTTHEHLDSQEWVLSPTPQELSPVAERPSSTSSSTLGIVRSRTLPSRRDHTNGEASEGGSLAEDEGRRARVLRKQKRLSSQPKREGAE